MVFLAANNYCSSYHQYSPWFGGVEQREFELTVQRAKMAPKRSLGMGITLTVLVLVLVL